MILTIVRLLNDDAGGSLVEYALLLALIALATIASLKKFDTKLTKMFTTAADDFKR